MIILMFFVIIAYLAWIAFTLKFCFDRFAGSTTGFVAWAFAAGLPLAVFLQWGAL